MNGDHMHSGTCRQDLLWPFVVIIGWTWQMSLLLISQPLDVSKLLGSYLGILAAPPVQRSRPGLCYVCVCVCVCVCVLERVWVCVCVCV